MPLSDEPLTVTADGWSARFAPLAWDSHFFSLPCYALDATHPAPPPAGSEATLAAALAGHLAGTFATAKIDASADRRLPSIFQDAGFTLLDIEMVLAHEGPRPVAPTPPGVRVDRDRDLTDEAVAALGSAFDLTRFHLDSCIGHAKADDLWTQWLRNALADAGVEVFAARIEDRPAGVIVAKIEDGEACLSFVAVARDCRGRGVGGALMRAALAELEGYRIRTETQAANIRAMNFYLRHGFTRLKSARFMLHRW